jgi:hypothetical protein
MELYTLMQQWLKSLQDDPVTNSKPYYVTLAPIAIAEGPIPPNAVLIQHAQDILVICAKERSKIFDGMNLMDYIVQNPSRYEFEAPTTPVDILESFRGYQADLDTVAAAASQAMDDVAKAVTPADYASEKGISYPQGVPPTPMPTLNKGLKRVLAAKGEAIAKADPLFAALRDQQPAGPGRLGFDIGAGASEGQTLWGPGKQKLMETLDPAEQPGFMTAVAFALERNNNADFAAKGAAVADADPDVKASRSRQRSALCQLGFDIATGIFGDPALGATGNTVIGPGSQGIRSKLSPDGQTGFDAAVKLHLGPPLRKRLT